MREIWKGFSSRRKGKPKPLFISLLIARFIAAGEDSAPPGRWQGWFAWERDQKTLICQTSYCRENWRKPQNPIAGWIRVGPHSHNEDDEREANYSYEHTWVLPLQRCLWSVSQPHCLAEVFPVSLHPVSACRRAPDGAGSWVHVLSLFEVAGLSPVAQKWRVSKCWCLREQCFELPRRAVSSRNPKEVEVSEDEGKAKYNEDDVQDFKGNLSSLLVSDFQTFPNPMPIFPMLLFCDNRFWSVLSQCWRVRSCSLLRGVGGCSREGLGGSSFPSLEVGIFSALFLTDDSQIHGSTTESQWS